MPGTTDRSPRGTRMVLSKTTRETGGGSWFGLQLPTNHGLRRTFSSCFTWMVYNPKRRSIKTGRGIADAFYGPSQDRRCIG